MKTHPIDTAAAAVALRALGNETRLQIVLRLLQGEAAVSDIERDLGLRQPNLSQQLAELRDAGLVVGRRESKSVIYNLANASQERLVTALSYGFGGAGPAPVAAPTPVIGKRRAHLGAVFARVTVDG
jgi:DNA-binding transcriptional ArsR family regulator